MSNKPDLYYEKIQSDTIKLVRFPLIIGVVMLHLTFENAVIAGQTFINPHLYPAYEYYKFFFDKVLAVRIPLYFFISGYLFFNRADHFTRADYFKKIRRRVDTLLIPYVSWLILAIGILALQQSLFSDFSSGKNIPIAQWGLKEIYYAFWDGPILGALWFVRDLFSLMLLSPLLYVLIKRFKIVPVVIFVIAYVLFPIRDIPGISMCGLAFFGMGAYFSLTKRNFVKTFAPYSWQIYLLYTLLAVGLFLLRGSELESYYNRFIIPVGSICVILICSHLLAKNVCRPSDTLANASFFIYVFHQLPTMALQKLVVKYVPMHSSFMLIGMHLLCTAVVVGAGLVVYLLIRKYSPLLLKLLSGGR